MPRIRVRARTTGEQTPTHHAAVPSMMTGEALVELCREWKVVLQLSGRHWSCEAEPRLGYNKAWFDNGDMLVREDATGTISVVPRGERRKWHGGMGASTTRGEGAVFSTSIIQPAPIIEAFRYDGTADIPDLVAWVNSHESRWVDHCEVRVVSVKLRDEEGAPLAVVLPGDVLTASNGAISVDLGSRHYEVVE